MSKRVWKTRRIALLILTIIFSQSIFISCTTKKEEKLSTSLNSITVVMNPKMINDGRHSIFQGPDGICYALYGKIYCEDGVTLLFDEKNTISDICVEEDRFIYKVQEMDQFIYEYDFSTKEISSVSYSGKLEDYLSLQAVNKVSNCGLDQEFENDDITLKDNYLYRNGRKIGVGYPAILNDDQYKDTLTKTDASRVVCDGDCVYILIQRHKNKSPITIDICDTVVCVNLKTEEAQVVYETNATQEKIVYMNGESVYYISDEDKSVYQADYTGKKKKLVSLHFKENEPEVYIQVIDGVMYMSEMHAGLYILRPVELSKN